MQPLTSRMGIGHTRLVRPRRVRNRGKSRNLAVERLENRNLLAVIHVATFDDPVPDLQRDTGYSLREAILLANSNSESDTIHLAAGTYVLSLEGDRENLGFTGDLDLTTGSIVIIGAGTHETVIDAGGIDRVFDVMEGVTVRLEALTITGGRSPGGSTDEPQAEDGGGIRNAGKLQLIQVMVRENGTAPSIAPHRSGAGGGIANSGNLTVTESSIMSNWAADGASGADGGPGGGIYNTSGLMVDRSTIAWSTAGSGGDSETSAPGHGGSGGGIYSSTSVFLVNSTISGNAAGHGGDWLGAVDEDDSPTGGLGGQGGGLWIYGDSLFYVTITGNRSGDGGLPEGSAGIGGGLFNAYPTPSADFPFIINTLVAGNYRGRSTTPDDIFGNFGRARGNLVGDAETSGSIVHSSGQRNIVGNQGTGTLDINVVLDTNLQDNGGPTWTHALPDDSPAVNAAVRVGLPYVPEELRMIDQRNLIRDGTSWRFDKGMIFGDIGAYEIVVPVVISGRIFEDINGDGDDEDGGDPGVNFPIQLPYNDGRTVTLIPDGLSWPTIWPRALARSQEDGSYILLVDLGVGKYTLIYDLLPGTWWTTDTAIIYVDVRTGMDSIQFDVGVFQSPLIAGRVYHDLNGDGDDENGTDPGMSGVNVFHDMNGNGVRDLHERFAGSRWDADGVYDFADQGLILPGLYTVRVEMPPGYVLTTANPDPFQLLSGTDVNIDFGLFKQITIAGRVFDDLNGDGAYDEHTETGLSSVTVFLDEDGDRVLGDDEPHTVTLDDGSYAFPGVGPGTWPVRMVLPEGTIQTTPDPDPIVATGGVDVSGVHFGSYQLAVLRGQHYEDANGNGRRDPSELGMDEWTVELLDRTTGQVIATQSTASIDWNGDQVIDPETEQGWFSFTDVVGGDFEVRVVQRTGWEATAPHSRLSPVATLDAAAGTSEIKSADLNGDGLLDLVVATDSGSVLAYFNAGDGTFPSAVPLISLMWPSQITFADLNDDHAVDIVMTAVGDPSDPSSHDNVLVVLMNDGQGAFSLAQVLPSTGGPLVVAAADLNGDGVDDLVVANLLSSGISVLVNDGTGGLSLAGNHTLDAYPSAIALGDVDGDGDVDVVSVSYTADHATIWLNDGHGNLTPSATLPIGTAVSQVQLGDLDGDTRVDLLLANDGMMKDPSQGTAVTILRNLGNGTFAAAHRIGFAYLPESLATGDFNGDGAIDVVVAVPTRTSSSTGAGEVAVLFGDGLGGFSMPFYAVAGDWPVSMAIGDWDGDGDVDLAVANHLGGNVSLLDNQPASYLLGIRSSGEVHVGLDFASGRTEARDSWEDGGGPMIPAGEFPFHNPQLAADVSGDGHVTPQDALIVINDLNARGARWLVPAEGESGGGIPSGTVFRGYVDTNGDNCVSPIDVLIIVNALNAVQLGEGERAELMVWPAMPLDGALWAARLAIQDLDSTLGMHRGPWELAIDRDAEQESMDNAVIGWFRLPRAAREAVIAELFSGESEPRAGVIAAARRAESPGQDELEEYLDELATHRLA